LTIAKQKNAQFENNPSYQKIFPKKLITRHNMLPNTLASSEYKGKIYDLNVRKN
jgi:hypothetical protein